MYLRMHHQSSSSWRSFLFGGLAFFLAGIVVITVPQILIAIVAAMLFLAGAALVSMAIFLRRSDRRGSSYSVHLL